MSELSVHRGEPAPVRVGTHVRLDARAQFLDRNYLVGGSPWRLVRLPGASRGVAQRWKKGDTVRPGEERFARTLIRQGLLHPSYPPDQNLHDVDIIIPVRDNISSLRQLLTQLQGLNITVVDDACADPLVVRECCDQFNVNLVRLEHNLGAAGARNAGALVTSRSFLCFIDDDVSFTDVHDVLSHLRAQFDDHEVGACAPRVRGAGGATSREHFEERFCPLDMGPRGALVVPNSPVSYVPTACLMVRREAFADGFNEDLRFGEDVDFVWRLHDTGWLVRYLANVGVHHRTRSTWTGWLSQRVHYGASSSELALRHGERLAPVRADAWTLVAWGSVLFRKPAIAARIARVARDNVRAQVESECDNPEFVANVIVTRTMFLSARYLARSIVRTYGIGLLLLAFHPRLRRAALGLFALGTAARWTHERVHAKDIPLGVLDDAAYGVGVAQGAWKTKSLQALTPKITTSSMTLRDVLGLDPKKLRSVKSE